MKIRVVVIDDSAYNRRTITKMLEGLPEIEVVGYAADGEEGIRKIIDLKPDLVTLDLEMPRMDGFTLLRIIMSKCPTPVIVISARSEDERVFKALELGALDFIAKPTSRISQDLLNIQHDLLQKVRSVFNLNMASIKRREKLLADELEAAKKKVYAPAPQKVSAVTSAIDVVAIGASTGGPPALQSIFLSFTEKFPFAVVVSQHMPVGFTRTFAERLNRFSGFDIREAQDGDPVRPGEVLVAPGGYNLEFRRAGGEAVARLVKPSSEDRYVPSVDAMFRSCAEVFGSRILGVVLTGMGNDGSQGVRAIKTAGGLVLAESKESAVVFGMPREAIATGVVDKVVTVNNMAQEILERCGVVDKRKASSS